MKKLIYFDNNSTEPLYPEVCQVIFDTLRKLYGNPSTSYSIGRDAKIEFQKARSKIQDTLKVKNNHFIKFTSCASESNVLVARGRVALFMKPFSKSFSEQVKGRPFKPHVITTQIEHASVYETLLDLEKANCCTVTFLPVQRGTGRVDLNALKKSIKPETVLISIIGGNNEIGTIQPLREIVEIVKRAKDEQNKKHKLNPKLHPPSYLFLHFDLTQIIGRLDVNLSSLNVDAATLGSHKFGGPRYGGLFIRDASQVHSFMTGGHQEGGFRAGTENIPYAVGMAKAMEISLKHWNTNTRHILEMRNFLKEEMTKKALGGKVNGDQESFLINTLSVSFPYANGKWLMQKLDEFGICVNVGSACSKGDRSRTLEAIQLSPEEEQGTIRISLSPSNTMSECKYFIDKLKFLLVNDSDSAHKPQRVAMAVKAKAKAKEEATRPRPTRSRKRI
jgi:cysteine desulfurase